MADKLDEEISAFEQMRPHLEREHAGKFALITGGKLIGAYDTFELAAHEGLRRFKAGEFLVRQIGGPEVELSAAVLFGLAHADRPSGV